MERACEHSEPSQGDLDAPAPNADPARPDRHDRRVRVLPLLLSPCVPAAVLLLCAVLLSGPV